MHIIEEGKLTVPSTRVSKGNTLEVPTVSGGISRKSTSSSTYGLGRSIVSWDDDSTCR